MIEIESGIAGSRYEEGKSPLRFSGLTLKNMNVLLLSGVDYITFTITFHGYAKFQCLPCMI